VSDVAVERQPDQSRFYTEVDGWEGELVYQQNRNVITFLHTLVADELEGQGVGSSLARAGLDYARQQGLQVVPSCPFVRGYIERHQEYAGLVRRT
jgi:predicted GNAT family acetyltransferase